MARGTGLPTINATSISPLVDMSAFGAGERESAQAWDRLSAGIGKLQEAIEPEVRRQARKDAERAVSEGRFGEMPSFTAYGREYSAAVRDGALARYASEDDAVVNAMVAQNPYDPDGFQRAADGYLGASMKDTDPGLSIARGERFRRRVAEVTGNMRIAQAERGVREAGVHVTGRIEELNAEIARKAENAAAFQVGSADFATPLEELQRLHGEIARNPLLGISEDEAERRYQASLDRFQAAALAGHVRRVFREQGPAAALAEVQTLLPPVLGPEVTAPSAGAVQGLITPGNIDLSTRPTVSNADGTVSTVRSISIEQDGQTYLIPTVTDDGRVVSDDEAVALFQQTGRHLGIFDGRANADSYAQVLHEDQANGLIGAEDASPTGGLSEAARDQAYDLAMAAYAEEAGLAQQQATIATAARTQASQRAEDLMTSMRYGAEVDHDELRQLAEQSGDPGLVARARWAIEVGVQPPEGFGASGAGGASYSGDATVAGGFAGAVDFVIDQLEGGEAFVADDNGRGPTRFGINSAANPDLDIQNLTRPVAVARYKRDYWDAIGADQLPPALALIAFDAAVNQGPADARRWIAESGGDPARYLALREADYRDLAARDPRHRRHLQGWLSRLESVRLRAARVQSFQNNADGFSSDPISFAMGNANRPALANVSSLPVNAVFSPSTAGAWGQARKAPGVGDELASDRQRAVVDQVGRVTEDLGRIQDGAAGLPQVLHGRDHANISRLPAIGTTEQQPVHGGGDVVATFYETAGEAPALVTVRHDHPAVGVLEQDRAPGRRSVPGGHTRQSVGQPVIAARLVLEGRGIGRDLHGVELSAQDRAALIVGSPQERQRAAHSGRLFCVRDHRCGQNLVHVPLGGRGRRPFRLQQGIDRILTLLPDDRTNAGQIELLLIDARQRRPFGAGHRP